MEGFGWNSFHNIFKLFCIIATIILVLWCCYEFSKDEDVCEVLFKRFLEDDDSVYPTLTIVITNLFNETKLKKYDESFTSHAYQNFLTGPMYFWNPGMLNVDFEDVSMNVEDYIIKACLFRQFHEVIGRQCVPATEVKKAYYFNSIVVTFPFPEKTPVYQIAIKFKKSIFGEGGNRPITVDPNHYLNVLISYDNAIYNSYSASFDTWPARSNESSKHYNMRFLLKSMEVLRRRQKRSNKCYADPDYDKMIREHIIKNVGCRPSFWAHNSTHPTCTTKDSSNEIISQHFDHLSRLNITKEYFEACLSIEKLQIEYLEADIETFPYGTKDNETDEDWFMMEFAIMMTKFKEIKQTRAYSVQSLVGNLGGYIGLCLGYAILNLPSTAIEIWKTLKQLGGQGRRGIVSHEAQWAENAAK